MDKTSRQKLGIQRWIDSGGHGSLVYATGVGKTWTAVMVIELLLKNNPDADVLIIVPTQLLKEQWYDDYILPRHLENNCRIVIINSAIKGETSCDLLIIDECHKIPTPNYSSIFTTVDYKMILCLTGTLERLDGKENLIKKYAPVCDTITFEEACKNGWVSPVKKYCVMLDVDLSEYTRWNSTFNGEFAFFNYNFELAMRCATDFNFRKAYANQMGLTVKEITARAMIWNKALRSRKTFILSHPHKIEVARRILEARKDKKCITFSATIKDAESIGIGYVLHSKKSKKENKNTIDKFNSEDCGVLNSSKAADQGLDVKGLSVGIILATDSSKIRATQRVNFPLNFWYFPLNFVYLYK